MNGKHQALVASLINNDSLKGKAEIKGSEEMGNHTGGIAGCSNSEANKPACPFMLLCLRKRKSNPKKKKNRSSFYASASDVPKLLRYHHQ